MGGKTIPLELLFVLNHWVIINVRDEPENLSENREGYLERLFCIQGVGSNQNSGRISKEEVKQCLERWDC